MEEFFGEDKIRLMGFQESNYKSFNDFKNVNDAASFEMANIGELNINELSPNIELFYTPKRMSPKMTRSNNKSSKLDTNK